MHANKVFVCLQRILNNEGFIRAKSDFFVLRQTFASQWARVKSKVGTYKSWCFMNIGSEQHGRCQELA